MMIQPPAPPTTPHRATATLGRPLSAVLLVVCSWLPGGVDASMVRALSLEQLVAAADHVVLARAEERQSRRHLDGRLIVTDVSLRVERTLKGDAQQGGSLVATRLGGRLQDIALQVPGEATFALGQRAIVFLRQAEPYGELRVVGMSQGVLPVRDRSDDTPAMVTPGGGSTALVQRDVATGKLTLAPAALGDEEPLTDLLSRIESLVAAQRASQPRPQTVQ
jgi:hypothetical protein